MREGAEIRTAPVGGYTLSWMFLMSFRKNVVCQEDGTKISGVIFVVAEIGVDHPIECPIIGWLAIHWGAFKEQQHPGCEVSLFTFFE
jgi:hypothetical protein